MGYASEVLDVLGGTTVPAKKSNGAAVNAGLRRFRATLDLSLASVDKNSGQNNVLSHLPPGFVFSHCVISSSVALSTSSFQIGVTGDIARYVGAVTYGNTPEIQLSVGKTTAKTLAPLTKREQAIVTIGSLALPGAGIIVFDIYGSASG